MIFGNLCKSLKEWWLEPELNRRHKDFQSSALPTELSSHCSRYFRNGTGKMNQISAQCKKRNDLSTLKKVAGRQGQVGPLLLGILGGKRTY
jgi:hypothetical protein